MKEKERQIINYYGVIPQLKYMQTEMFEFIDAVLAYENQVPYCDRIWDKNLINYFKKHIEEEYADLTMMLEQFKEYYHLNEDYIQRIKDYKIERQLDRIKNAATLEN